MSWFDALFRPHREKSAPADLVTEYLLRNTMDSAPAISQEDYLRAYQVSLWTNACVTAIARACASVPLRLVDGDGNEVPDHPALAVLDYVNPDDDYMRLCGGTVAYKLLSGDAYWLMGYASGQPGSLYNLRPDRVEIKPAKRGLTGYKYTNGDVETLYKPEEIVHFRRWNPVHDWHGQPVIQPAETTINLDKAIRDFNDGFMRRGAVPAFALVAQADLRDEQIEAIGEEWRRRYGGSKNAGRVAVMGNGLEPKILGQASKDGQYIELAKLVREEILAAFGVPPVIVGLLEYASYANAKEQKAIFWRDCIVDGNLREYLSELNENFIPKFPDAETKGLRLEPDLKEVEALHEDQAALSQRVQAAVGVPYMTVNEARQQMGLDRIERPEYDVVSAPFGGFSLGLGQPDLGGSSANDSQSADTGAQPAATDAAAATPAKVAKPAVRLVSPVTLRTKRVFGDEEHVKAWNGFLRDIKPLEERYAQTMLSVYGKWFDETIANLRREEQKGYTKSLPMPWRVLFDLDEAGDLVVRELIPLATAALQLGGRRALGQLGGGTFDVGRPEAQRWLQAKELKVRTIPQTMHDELRKRLETAVANGDSIGTMVDNLRELQPQLTGYQAERIARTETVGATNRGTVEGYRQNGVVGKQWMSAIDERTRSVDAGDEFDHVAMDGVTVRLDDSFTVPGKNGDDTVSEPGDPDGAAGDIINCRCTVVPVLDASDLE